MHLDCMEYAGGRPLDVVHGGPAGALFAPGADEGLLRGGPREGGPARRAGPEPPRAPIPARPAEPWIETTGPMSRPRDAAQRW